MASYLITRDTPEGMAALAAAANIGADYAARGLDPYNLPSWETATDQQRKQISSGFDPDARLSQQVQFYEQNRKLFSDAATLAAGGSVLFSTGSSGGFLSDILAGPQRILDQNIGWIVPVVLTAMGGYVAAGAAGVIGAAEGTALVEGGAVVSDVALVVEAPETVSLLSGAPAFSAEAAAAEAFVFESAAITPAAGSLGGPALFSAEALAAEAFGGNVFAAPAAEVLSLASVTDAVKVAQQVKGVVGIGAALRSALGAGPAQAAPLVGAYGSGTPGDTFVSDVAWTIGAALAAVFGVVAAVRFARG